MKDYIVYYNNDGILVQEPVQAEDEVVARELGQELHPDLEIIAVKLIKK
jgi:hypothetical protein